MKRKCGGGGAYIANENMAVFDGMLDRRAIKMNLANEGFEARKKEEEVTAKKRKAEDDARWEGNVLSFRTDLPGNSHARPTETREQRVGSWRTFSNTSKKKKKQKGDVLG